MTMTTTDFVNLAREMSRRKPQSNATRPPNPAMVVQWSIDVEGLCKVCESSNRLFNKEKFLKACNGE